MQIIWLRLLVLCSTLISGIFGAAAIATERPHSRCEQDVSPSAISSCSPTVEKSHSLDNLAELSAAVLDFTEADSDLAVTLFGCDCSLHMSWLQQMRSAWLN